MATLQDITSSVWSLDAQTPGAVVQGTAAIIQQINIVLKTVKGSDPLRPQFGCGIFDYIDIPLNQSAGDMVREISESLQIWVPLITVTKVVPTLINDSQLSIAVSFIINGTTGIQSTNINYGQ